MRKKISAVFLAAVMVLGSSVFAAAPSEYDGQSYESLGYTSDDSDGEFNLAVITNGDAYIIGNNMEIAGSVYSNGNIYVGNGNGNKIEGLFISGTEGSIDKGDNSTPDWVCEGYIHVTNEGTRDGISVYSARPEYEGAIKDENTSFECSFESFSVPEISNVIDYVEMTIYGNEQQNNLPQVISVDTRINKLKINGTERPALTIDTTNGDVNLVIDEIATDSSVPNIKVTGENQANIYINNARAFDRFIVNSPVYWDDTLDGNTEGTHLYLTGSYISFSSSNIGADITVNADTFEVIGGSHISGDINTNAKVFTIGGDPTDVTGVVCAPYAASKVYAGGILYGQLHTDTLTNGDRGKILYKADAAVAEAEIPEPTNEPEITPEPTEPPLLPDGPEKDYEGFNYAYIFGYEPYDSDDGSIMLEMAAEEKVTREQVCAMLVRVDDQYNNKVGKTRYLEEGIFNDNATSDRWSYNALAAVAETKAFDSYADLDPAGHISRGEVARIVAFMTGLTEIDEDIVFEDAVGNENEAYIKLVATAGYMQGYEDGTFDPEAAITRAEFCSLLNNVIGRDSDNGYYLETADGNPITHDTYGFTDLEPSDWYYETVLYATSAFDDNGYVDLELRIQNIRNKLDGYDAQYDY